MGSNFLKKLRSTKYFQSQLLFQFKYYFRRGILHRGQSKIAALEKYVPSVTSEEGGDKTLPICSDVINNENDVYDGKCRCPTDGVETEGNLGINEIDLRQTSGSVTKSICTV